MRAYYAVGDDLENRRFDAADMRQAEAEAQSRGITLGQLMEEAGVVRRPDGGWEWSAPHPGEHAGMRYAYDERDIFRTEDPLAIELGSRATEGLVSKTAPMITGSRRSFYQGRRQAGAGQGHGQGIRPADGRDHATGSGQRPLAGSTRIGGRRVNRPAEPGGAAQ